MRTFKTKWLTRFARREGIADKSLREAIERAERGLIDADLGGGLIKQRVARQGQGRSLPIARKSGPSLYLGLPRVIVRTSSRTN